MGLYDFTFYEVICRNAELWGERPAWIEAAGGRTLSFREIKEEVDGMAAAMQEAGFRQGDRIGVLGKNSWEYFRLFGAAAALGGILIPLNWRLAPEEIAFNLDDAQPGGVFFDPECLSLVEAVVPLLAHRPGIFSLTAGSGGFPGLTPQTPAAGAWEPAAVQAADGLLMIHTAAVGGRPRGALLSHGNLLWAHAQLLHGLGTTPEEVHLGCLPLFHVAGLFMATQTFHAGALTVNLPRFDAAAALELIQEHRVTLMFDFAPMLEGLLDAAEQQGGGLGSLKKVLGLDAPAVIGRYQAATGGTFYTLYGQTETSMLVTLGAHDACPGAAGRPLPMARLRLVDNDDRPVARGEVGEITLKGPLVFQGYWNRPGDNAQTFRGGWHHTGDLGRLDEAGFLWYAGRKAEKELIKTGGENVYPAEVEQVILEHPAVEGVVVFGVPDARWQEGVKAVCLLREGEAVSAEALIAFVGQRIAGYKKPRCVTFVDELPRKPDGTIDRQEVKRRHGD